MTKEDIFTGLLIDENSSFSLLELSQSCNTRTEWIIELVDEGILEPSGQDTDEWYFSGPSLKRARIVKRLQRDLEINIAGAALILDMMDELERMRAQLQMLETYSI